MSTVNIGFILFRSLFHYMLQLISPKFILFPAAASSLPVAIQLVMVLKALVDCATACENQSADERRRRASFVRITGLLPLMRARLSVSAGRVLTHDWDAFEPWKSKVRTCDLNAHSKLIPAC